ncbi:MAG: Fe-S cluster assembly protein SufD [Pseudomonadota bacterium]
MTAAAVLGGEYARQFADARAALPGGHLPWLKELREQAIARFSVAGFPTPRVEEWKFTNLAPLTRTPFAPARPADGLHRDRIERLCLGAVPHHRLVFVDGRYRPALSAIGKLPAGVRLISLAAALDEEPELVAEHMSADQAIDGQALSALNAAFMADGAVLELAPGIALDEPVHLLFVSSAAGAAVHPRNLVVAGPGSRAAVLETYADAGGTGYWTNAVSVIAAAPGATVRHYKLQREDTQSFHIASTRARLAGGSVYDSFVMSVGGRLSRNEIHTTLDGAGIDCRLAGAYLLRGQQHADTTTVIDHARAGSTSVEVYKGVIDDAARGVFQGKIVVRPDAQKTNARQLNHNLLLSPRAQADTKPELRIEADDVQCSHGAGVGQLDADAMFYLRARGLDEHMARSLLIDGFVGELIDAIHVGAVQTHLHQALWSWSARV